MRCCIKIRWIYCIDYRRSCWGPCVSAYCGYTWSSWNCDTGCISLCNCIGLACIKSCVSYRAACSIYADRLYCICRTCYHSSVEVVIIGSTAQYYIVVCRRCCRCTIETLCYFDCSCGCRCGWNIIDNIKFIGVIQIYITINNGRITLLVLPSILVKQYTFILKFNGHLIIWFRNSKRNGCETRIPGRRCNLT